MDPDQTVDQTAPRGALGLILFARHINPSLVLVQPRETRPYLTDRLLMGCKESNQTNTPIVCFDEKILSEVYLNICSRLKKKWTTFSGQDKGWFCSIYPEYITWMQKG